MTGMVSNKRGFSVPVEAPILVADHVGSNPSIAVLYSYWRQRASFGFVLQSTKVSVPFSAF